MPEIAEHPRSNRFVQWWSDSLEVLEGAASWLVSLAITSVARKNAVKQLASSHEAMGEGLSAAVDLHRAMKKKISPDDPAERELFELFSGVAIAQTKLMAACIENGISPQPIDVKSITRPTLPPSRISRHALPHNEASESLEAPHHQENHQEQENQTQPETTSGEPQKRKRGRPHKDQQQEPTNGEPPKRKRGRPEGSLGKKKRGEQNPT